MKLKLLFVLLYICIKQDIVFTEANIYKAAAVQNDALKEILCPISNQEILEVFFRVLFEESQGGYVLYGCKPICTEGILPSDTNLLILGSDLHRKSIFLKEGFKIWEKLASASNKYFIHLFEKPSYGWQQLVLINREEFIRVVQENLPLFQYILGPDTSPEGLFAKLIDREESFSSVFQDNKVLVGIALGFGTQNALHVSREEAIEESFLKKDRIPLKPLAIRSKEPRKKGGYEHQLKETLPAFGYSSLKEELDHLNQIVFVSNELVGESFPSIPWFGCLKSKETKHLVEKYSKTQKVLRKVLMGEQFLAAVLTQLLGEKRLSKTMSDLNAKNQFLLLGGDLNWSSIIAQFINQALPEHDEKWVESFIHGMQANEEQDELLSKIQWYHLLDRHKEIEQNLRCKRNFDACEKFFARVRNRKDLTCLVPDKLYYKVIKEGKGETVKSPFSLVQLDYIIKDHSGVVINVAQDSKEEAVDLSDLIMGMSIAIKGMNVGEEREIYIHPSLAYGELYNSSPNQGLVVEVKLRGIMLQGIAREEQPIIPLELSAAGYSEDALNREYQLLRHQIASQLGSRTWAHFKKGQEVGYSLETVKQALFQESKRESVNVTSAEAQAALAKLHWRIYHSSKIVRDN